jgi:hypothetical protein
VKTAAPSPLPPNFQLGEFGGSNVFFEITSDATYNPDVEVCVRYTETGGIVDGTTTHENDLKMLHLNDVTLLWEDVTNPGPAGPTGNPDTDDDIVCGTVDSFSFFAVAGAGIAIPALPLWSYLVAFSALLATGTWWLRTHRALVAGTS